MPRYLTVVYTIHDEKEFEAEKAAINDKFKSSEGEPWAITAMSLDHEIQRVHLIEEALDRDEYRKADMAIGHVDIGNIKSLEQL